MHDVDNIAVRGARCSGEWQSVLRFISAQRKCRASFVETKFDPHD